MDALSLPSAFFRGANSSSLATSNTTKFLSTTSSRLEKNAQTEAKGRRACWPHPQLRLGPLGKPPTTTSYLEKGKTSKTNFSILIPLALLGRTRFPHESTNGTFLSATCCFSWSLKFLGDEMSEVRAASEP